jgi:hypothetical protein
MTIWKRQGMIAAACGFGFLALFAIGFVVLNLVASDFYPSPFDDAAKIERYFAENRSEARTVAFFYAVAAVALLCFAAYLADLARRSEGEMGALPGLALGGGVVAAVFLMISALCLWLLGREATLENPALVRALHDLAYLAGGPAHVIAFAPFLGASSVAGLRSRVLPGWIAWLGIAAAATSLPTVGALLWEPAAYLLPIARLLTYAWIFAVSLALALGWSSGAGVADRGAIGEAFGVRADRIRPETAPPGVRKAHPGGESPVVRSRAWMPRAERALLNGRFLVPPARGRLTANCAARKGAYRLASRV